MKGELVILRTAGGIPLVGRVWEDAEAVVLVSSEAGYVDLENGSNEIIPVGLRPDDVFVYDPNALSALQSGAVKWSDLRPYRQ